RKVDFGNIEQTVEWFERKIPENDFPADGLVLVYDDIAYGESLGTTAKFPRDAIAFKWMDETKETRLLEIEWSASRTGLINPIAIFEPVELEGTTVKRASLHNISIMESLELGIGDMIGVYKANMIIPQVSENFTRSGTVKIPSNCPVCGEGTSVRQENGIKFLYCMNKDCLAKQIKSFTHFVSRDAMGIDGLSEATIEKFIAKGFIKEYADIYRIEKYRDEIVDMEGFGEKSFRNLVNSINKSRKTNAVRLLYGLGIPNIGLSNAKLICSHFSYDWNRIENAAFEELISIKGIGEVMAGEYVKFFSSERNRRLINNLLQELELEKAEVSGEDQIFKDITFVITGQVYNYKNRGELKRAIEGKGGKVTDSVTSNTDYLINNDILSNSAKNRKAKELGIKIIDEAAFIEWLNGGIQP
ncbi:MAG: NAD-dependent DNA ligase LigA, partial [Clostridiaceae bacterium]|nr:NAD-dependent DNA ligase LigA [Clostridiaceae bacterium]